MGSLKIKTASSGSVILSAANTASDVTITVPAVTGTMLTTASTFAGTGPAFSAYQSTLQSISLNTWTKVKFQTEEFDTNSNFDNTTNYRFTPTVAGYYQVNGRVASATANSIGTIAIYKNGAEFKDGSQSTQTGSNVSSLVYFNGSTDYIEIYAYFTATSNTVPTAFSCYFQASMVRAA